LLLSRLYAHTDETNQELQGLSYMVLPFMVAGLRPLCELLTTMPIAEDDHSGKRAGPSFEIYSSLAFLPHKQAAWQLLYERLQLTARRCKSLSEQPGMPERLANISDTIQHMANRFKLYVNL
jgi:hypothetical protein